MKFDQNSSKGFTLIELLVVISVIALLIALLLPALRQAREIAQTTKCLTNTKQFSVAFQLYADEHDGALPSFQQQLGKAHAIVALGSYMGQFEWEHATAGGSHDSDTSIWTCPMDTLTLNFQGDIRPNRMGYGVVYGQIIGYGPNLMKSRGGVYPYPIARPPWRLAQVTRPGLTMAMTGIWVPVGAVYTPVGIERQPLDADMDGDGQLDSSTYIWSWQSEKFNWHAPVIYNNVAARHKKRANVAYFDGHAGMVSIVDMMNLPDNEVLWGMDMQLPESNPYN